MSILSIVGIGLAILSMYFARKSLRAAALAQKLAAEDREDKPRG